MKINITANNERGQSLVELVIALGIFAILAGSVVVWLTGGFASLSRANELTQAQYLAQEAIEAVNAIKATHWQDLSYTESAVGIADNKWVLAGEGTVGQIGNFTRRIIFSDIYRNANRDIVEQSDPEAYLDILSKQVEVIVSWPVASGDRSIDYTTLISAWNAEKWEQNDWSGGGGQLIWQETDKFEIEDGNIDYDTILKLTEIATSTFALSGDLVSSAYNIGADKTALSVSWEETIEESCAECDILLQIKTADDNSGQPGSWSNTWCGPEGEDGDNEDFFTTSTPQSINADHRGKEWIKYKVTLLGNASTTPEMSSIKILYQ